MSPIFISRQQEQLGQFSEEDVKAGLQSGRFLPDDLAWREGMAEWQPLSSLGLAGAPRAATPLAHPGIPHPGVGQVLAPVPLTEGLPWERATASGWLVPWWETTRDALFAPVSAFSAMKVEGGYGKPLTYLMICSFISALVYALCQVAVQAVMASSGSGEAMSVSFMGLLCAVPVAIGAGLLMAAIGAVITAFVGGAITHGCLILFSAAGSGFEGTVRAICYATGAVNALQIVPILGWIAAIFWGPIVYVIALKEAHKTEYWRVICASLIPVLLCCGCLVGIGMAFAGSMPQIMESLQNQNWQP